MQSHFNTYGGLLRKIVQFCIYLTLCIRRYALSKVPALDVQVTVKINETQTRNPALPLTVCNGTSELISIKLHKHISGLLGRTLLAMGT